jgi:hypothetical protein
MKLIKVLPPITEEPEMVLQIQLEKEARNLIQWLDDIIKGTYYRRGYRTPVRATDYQKEKAKKLFWRAADRKLRRAAKFKTVLLASDIAFYRELKHAC